MCPNRLSPFLGSEFKMRHRKAIGLNLIHLLPCESIIFSLYVVLESAASGEEDRQNQNGQGQVSHTRPIHCFPKVLGSQTSFQGKRTRSATSRRRCRSDPKARLRQRTPPFVNNAPVPSLHASRAARPRKRRLLPRLFRQ